MRGPMAAAETTDQGLRRLHAAAYLPGGVLAVTASRPHGEGHEEDFSALLIVIGDGEGGPRPMGHASAAVGWDARTAAEVSQWARESTELLAG